MTDIGDPEVAAAFQAFPQPARARLLALRAMIFETAAKIDGVGGIAETLKWGEPAYRAKGGSTIRLGWKVKAPEEVAMYFICTTNLIGNFRNLYPHSFRFGGNRALLFGLTGSLPKKALSHCIAMALTYHRR